MSQTISFIHAADLHLDSPFQGLTELPDNILTEVRQSTFHALDKLVSTAINKQVDFILLVGDLFDNEKQSLKAQIYLKKAFEKLQQHHINVYMSYGNHDYTNGNIHPIIYPENVFVFPNETITSFTYKKDGVEVASISGFSYENRALMGNKVEEYPVRDDLLPFHIAMLHGTLHGNSEHDPYAPFLLSDLKDKQYDYWALGHIHKREILTTNPTIAYSGNIQGRHRNEGGEKGCYYVNMSANNTEMDFIPLQSIIFKSITIDISSYKTIHEIEEHVITLLKHHTHPKLIDITFESNGPNKMMWETDELIEEVVEIINETISRDDPWSYIYRYRFTLPELSQVEYDDFFIGELNHTFDQVDVSPLLDDLYRHREIKKHLEPLDNNEAIEIKKKARHLLLNELLRMEGE